MSDLVPLTGEPLALDLVNTRTAVGDLLATPDDLRAWVGLQAGRLPEAGVGPDALAVVRAVREHTAGALERARRGEPPAPADLAALNDAQRAAPAISELAWNGSAVVAERRRTGPDGARLAAALAEAAADLLGDPAVTRVRRCEADDCVLLFLPAHPRRRWCSASRCGNRMRVARHYQRHRPA
ncbi:CGNR zinc finger domain-containing protein [Actinomadura namibiensis]|uniref:Putative RNA-binding Zn ribbon-like protein n=1 Tax=Actinomadura namibiensis TaxID=182080 RepID=A0A7W3LLN3_ACTNM|nr:CGNR zinc finger domain-containing protein [Actinomadura namibiensis]MBA8950409.1 putative RNA-binding Zn ribbon-like protein [Actinomadura namibiensis]